MNTKKRTSGHLLDKMHRGVVYTCIAMTGYGLYLLGWRVHRYITVIRPAKQASELKMIQEGSSLTTTTEKDHAPTLRT